MAAVTDGYKEYRKCLPKGHTSVFLGCFHVECTFSRASFRVLCDSLHCCGRDFVSSERDGLKCIWNQLIKKHLMQKPCSVMCSTVKTSVSTKSGGMKKIFERILGGMLWMQLGQMNTWPRKYNVYTITEMTFLCYRWRNVFTHNYTYALQVWFPIYFLLVSDWIMIGKSD